MKSVSLEFEHQSTDSIRKNNIWLNCYDDGDISISVCFRTHTSVDGRWDERITKNQAIKMRDFLNAAIESVDA